MVFNPWDGQIPSQTPLALVNGMSSSISTTASTSLCGWFSLESPSMPSSVRFLSSGSGGAWGSAGTGSSGAIDLSSYGKYDTIWIAPKSGIPKITTTNPGNIGTCPSSSHAQRSTGRCDLQSSPLTGSTGCLDLDKIEGTTLDVPESVTRLSREGLVLCGAGKLTVPGSDIAYIVDQSGSMTAFRTGDLILPHQGDTINFGGCKEWTLPSGTKFPGTLPSVKYKGYTVQLLPANAYDSAMVRCSPSGDPYQVRAKVVQAAITKQAQLAPSSTAAFLSFGSKYSSTKLFSLKSVASRDSLLKQVIDTNLDKTYYADPIGWARALLQGAKSGSKTMSASPNTRKAIILVSDGAPNDADSAFAKLEVGKTVKAPDGTVWALPDTTSPPIYGFMLSTSASSGNALKKLATATGGAYYQIPPLDRDSLNRVMERLLGLLATRSTPDSLRITNLTNGQATNSVSSGAEGAGFRFPLDSIIGLDLGKNVLELRSAMHSPLGDSIRTVRWTLNVQASSNSFAPDGADSTLMASCYAPTRLVLRPATDTARRFADQRDTKLSTFLDTRPTGIWSFPVQLSSSVSKDTLMESLSSKPDTTATRAQLNTSGTWALSLTAPVRSDAILQTGYGWDTAHAVFHMPRDYRDSATAVLPLLHVAPTSIVLSPDTVSGDTGHILVSVTDPNLTTDTASAWIHHRLGDSLRVQLQRTALGSFSGTFAFHQDNVLILGDSILQMGPARIAALDTIWGAYQSSRDTASVKRIRLRLRFVLADGSVADDITSDTALRSRVPVRLQLWSANQPVLQEGTIFATSLDPRLVFSDSSGKVDSLFRLVKGQVTVWVRSDRPANALAATFVPDSAWATATAHALSWHSLAPDSAVYLDRDGDGALDQVRVHFRSPWNQANHLALDWPVFGEPLIFSDAVPVASSDSLTVEWNFTKPQRPAITAWSDAPVLGRFAWDASDSSRTFPIREALAPVPVRARLLLGNVVDTLRVWMSEPVRLDTGAEWIRWGRPSMGKDGSRIDRSSQGALSSRLVELLVDTAFPAVLGDSIRLATWPQGGISDSLGNGPGLDALWAPLEIVPGPFKISVAPWPPLATYSNWPIAPNESPLRLFARPGPSSPWLSPDGRSVTVDSSHYAGVTIRTTRNLRAGALYIYDNSGISVASIDLAPLLESFRKGTIQLPRRGDAQIWVAWNGKSQNGRIAASGVYLARIFGWAEFDGRNMIYNEVHKLGWAVP